MITHAYLLHGWGGSPTGAWKPWLKRELEKVGVQVVCPQLPNTDTPRIAEWVPFLEKLIASKPEETLIVAHSLSVPAVLMFLEQLPEDVRFAKVVFVGGVYRDILQLNEDEKRIAAPWLEHEYSSQHIRAVAPNITAFFSDDDPYIPLTTADEAARDFGVHTIIDRACGHYNGPEYHQFLDEITKSL